MDLMKELITTAQPVKEAEYSNVKYARFKKITDIVDKELDHLYVLAKPDSGFSKLVAELEGDVAIVNEIRQHLHKLADAFADLEMSVGMAQDPNRDDMGDL